jgi:serine O-acetyltransferase
MLDNFRADVDRYVMMEERQWLAAILTRQGLWAIAEYRFSHWVYAQVKLPILRQLLLLICLFWHKLVEILTGIDLPKQTEIGKGLYIPHFGGIFVHCTTKIGDYCTLGQDVTIGLGGRGENKGCPKIGDRVCVGAGARIIGAIAIGNDVAIGANAVVTKDLPDRAVAVGIPAKIISYQGSQGLVTYPEPETTDSQLTPQSD